MTFASRLALLLAVLLTAVSPNARAQSGAPLRVIRVTPAGSGAPLTEISVTFDRPVAGSLDRVVDAATILRVDPAVPGKIEWRDPVTIRLTPAAPLTPGATYTITVANNFRAMDGSALPAPYRFTFRAQGPLLIGGFPVGKDVSRARHLTPNQQFLLVYTAAVDLTKLSAAAYLEFTATCRGALPFAQRIVRLRAVSQRAIAKDDQWNIREAGGWQRNHTLDSLRRVVQLTPVSPLPHGCAGELVTPIEVEDQFLGGFERLGFDSYGDFRMSPIHCSDDKFCPVGPFVLSFSTPVRGADVLRRIRILPATTFTVRDTLSESTTWTLEGKLNPHVAYAVVADTALRDIFGQRLTGTPTVGYRTTGYRPTVTYPFGNLLVERVGFGTLSMQHINVDTLIATIAPVPDSLEAKVLRRNRWSDDSVWTTLLRGASDQRIPIAATADRAMLTGVRFPTASPARPNPPTLFAMRADGLTAGRTTSTDQPIALVQVTDLGVHARIGVSEGVVWVTGVNDGRAKVGATVVLHDLAGRALATARTDANGIARLTGWNTPAPTTNAGETEDDYEYGNFEGYVKVSLGDDRAMASINRWDPDLSPWRFNVSAAWGEDRLPIAGAVFTERGIYRPGERVYVKTIVRDGSLGALRVPAANDSIKWRFHDRDGGMLRETTTTLSAFGTAEQTLDLPPVASVGSYEVEVQSRRQGTWHTVAQTNYRVAEYRPPEFLANVNSEARTLLPGDTLRAVVQSRYLFGAPMGLAQFTWVARMHSMSWVGIPGLDGWYVGATGAWWEEDSGREDFIIATGTDTLDVRGEHAVNIAVPQPRAGRPGYVTLETSVVDINRQAVGASTSAVVHPADFYIALKPAGTNYFWTAGTPQSIDVLTVRPEGERVTGVQVLGTIVRREWHRVRRERNGISELVGEWVNDTTARCTITTAATPTPCAFTPREGGTYILTFTTTDPRGRPVISSFQRWASGSDWVPWSDESQFRMDVIPDRARYSVGDTATVLFASPFTDAEAWITVEREGLIEQRRLRLTSGSTTLEFPITEAYAPNAYLSIIVARGRSAQPGPLDDPGRPTIRVGYAELRVTPEVKRLTIALDPEKPEFRPADSARVRIRVRNTVGGGERSEVTLWAVDEGVLALTGYTTPDPIDLIYRERGLGLRLASNMTSVAPQVPEGEKGKREPGGGGGTAGADVLRSRFQTTAFFLGSVVTDAQGNALAAAKLPDNLTTFRIMAVAVTAGDRYGKGQSSLLVTRPLLARQALPRFVRPGDAFTAGAVINRRDGAAIPVKVRATATGVTLRGSADQAATLAPSRGAEVRFPFVATRTDSATFRFDVTDATNADAVRVALPVRPDYYPRAYTLAGVLHDTATVQLTLPSGIDPARSRLTLSLGTSPLAMIRGIGRSLRVYPYYCSEQVTSAAFPIIALYRAQRQSGATLITGNPLAEITRAVEMISRRQRTDGGIGFWAATDWSSAWLSAYAGTMLLEARDAGVPVDQQVLVRLADYLAADLHGTQAPSPTPLANWYERRETRLADQVAAADFLSRIGRADIPAENDLLRMSPLMTIEDRARLAEVLARRGQLASARQLMAPTWALMRVEGRRAVLPEGARTQFYFNSNLRPLSRILTATLAVDPQHALVGPIVETLAEQGRVETNSWVWNTQDYAFAVMALTAFDQHMRAQGERAIRVRAGNRTILQRSAEAGNAGRDSSIALTGLLSNISGGRSLRVSLDAGTGDGVVYYYLTVTEVPTTPPVTPDDRGIQVERWYERYTDGAPVSTVAEGDLVRVRLRITVPTTRQFVVLDDALPAGLEAIDLSLRTSTALPGPGMNVSSEPADRERGQQNTPWGYGSWDSGWWSPFDHREIRDERVVYSATILWPGTYTATYLARATTPGTFVKPPAHAEEMYNPGVNGRSDGGKFVVTQRGR